ncbi:MAG: MATE family efflux transporter [Gemmiger sp.]
MHTNHPARPNKMAVMPMRRLVLTMSLPLMVSLLVQSLYNIVDGIFVARISEDALTATSLAYPMQILMVAASVGTGVGVNALLSRLLGAGRQREAEEAATTGLVLSLLCTLLFLLLGQFATPLFVSLFTTDPVTGSLCQSYLRICMTFCLGIFMETLAQRLLQSTGNTFLSMISLVAGALTNIILDPILIFGLLGLPALGIRGAAIATVTGQWLGAVVAMALHHFKNPEIRFRFRGYHLTAASVGAIYKVGAPTILTQAMGCIMLSSLNGILMPLSSTAVAFFGVYYKLQNFLMMPIIGLGQAAIPIVGYNYGAKNPGRIREALQTMLPAALLIAAAGTGIFLVFPAQLLGLFSASEEMLAIGVPALRIICLTFVCAAATTVVGYAGAGLGNGLINLLGTALRQFLVLVPLVWLLSRSGRVENVWYAVWAAELAAAAFSGLCFWAELRRKVALL